MGHPLGDHAQDVGDHLFCRDGSGSMTPLDCCPEYRPTHHRCHCFARHPPHPRGWNLLEPAQEELSELLLSSPFKQGVQLHVSWPTLALHLWEVVEHRPDEHAQGAHSPFASRGEFLHHLPLKLLADGGLEQVIFIFKVSIKGGSIHARPLGDVLNGNGRKVLFLDKLKQGLLQELKGPLDAGINAFHMCQQLVSPFFIPSSPLGAESHTQLHTSPVVIGLRRRGRDIQSPSNLHEGEIFFVTHPHHPTQFG